MATQPPTPPSSSQPTIPPSPSLVAQASKLAHMTAELKLHRVVQQTAMLEQDLQKLTQRTEHNDVFRQQHEERLTKIWHEVLAVRALQTKAPDVSGCRDQVHTVRKEVQDLRRLVDDLTGRMDELGGGGVRRRIDETIRSTRRWHHLRKSSQMPEGDFAARYLRKQARRDPRMAVLLQKAIHRRVRRRGQAEHSHSLDEFCKHVCWEDVTATVQRVLVEKVDATVRSLSAPEG